MSELPNFSDFHRQGEQRVKAAIRNPDGQYEHIGREEDPRVAEAMAYAAKPLIDNSLNAMNNGTPNSNFLVTAEGHLTGPPTVTHNLEHEGLDYGYGQKTSTYGELAADVTKAHQAADKVQVDYYNKVADAKRHENEAKNSL